MKGTKDMKDDIASIPISDVFAEKDGCPVCRLKNMLNERTVTYITGAAMMEPDIRIETNRLGFCHKHYIDMLAEPKRLPVALILESHMAELHSREFPKGLSAMVKKEVPQSTCYVCRRIDHNMSQFLPNICNLWAKEKEFRNLYSEQPYLCLPHYRELSAAAAKMPRKERAEFLKITSSLAENKLFELYDKVNRFTKTFDYRSDPDSGENEATRDAVERAVEWITGEPVD